jgi:hypothetical protein
MLDRRSFVREPADLRAAHGARLTDLVGTRLDATWVAWDASDDSWFADEAVILRFGDTRLEILWWKFDEVAISWNQIDLTQRPCWIMEWQEPFDLTWRRNALHEMRAVVGRSLTRVALFEQLFETTVIRAPERPDLIGSVNANWILNGLEFQFGDCYLSVYNALDENGISDQPVERQAGRLRRIEL